MFGALQQTDHIGGIDSGGGSSTGSISWKQHYAAGAAVAAVTAASVPAAVRIDAVDLVLLCYLAVLAVTHAKLLFGLTFTPSTGDNTTRRVLSRVVVVLVVVVSTMELAL